MSTFSAYVSGGCDCISSVEWKWLERFREKIAKESLNDWHISQLKLAGLHDLFLVERINEKRSVIRYVEDRKSWALMTMKVSEFQKVGGHVVDVEFFNWVTHVGELIDAGDLLGWQKNALLECNFGEVIGLIKNSYKNLCANDKSLSKPVDSVPDEKWYSDLAEASRYAHRGVSFSSIEDKDIVSWLKFTVRMYLNGKIQGKKEEALVRTRVIEWAALNKIVYKRKIIDLGICIEKNDSAKIIDFYTYPSLHGFISRANEVGNNRVLRFLLVGCGRFDERRMIEIRQTKTTDSKESKTLPAVNKSGEVLLSLLDKRFKSVSSGHIHKILSNIQNINGLTQIELDALSWAKDCSLATVFYKKFDGRVGEMNPSHPCSMFLSNCALGYFCGNLAEWQINCLSEINLKDNYLSLLQIKRYWRLPAKLAEVIRKDKISLGQINDAEIFAWRKKINARGQASELEWAAERIAFLLPELTIDEAREFLSM